MIRPNVLTEWQDAWSTACLRLFSRTYGEDVRGKACDDLFLKLRTLSTKQLREAGELLRDSHLSSADILAKVDSQSALQSAARKEP